MGANMFHLYLKQDVAFLFDSRYYRKYEKKIMKEVFKNSANGHKDKDRGLWNNQCEQLRDTKTTGSTIFVSFGSEYFLSKADMTQIALGLEMSNVNFIWVLRVPKGENNMTIREALPLGFVERVKTRGLLVEGWAPQAKIVGHKNIGATVAEIVNEVMASNLGKNTMDKAKKISDDLETKGDEEIEYVVDDLLQLCQSVTAFDVIGAQLAPVAASVMGIPYVLFITTNATTGANMCHLYLKQDVAFPFDSRHYRKYEKKMVKEVFESSANGHKVRDRVMQGENNMTIKEALPLGFVKRVKTRGLLVEWWAPQAKILGHKNIGGFVSHCGWSSVMEAMKFGVLIIAMPIHLHQPVNARLVVEIGMGKEVVRNNKGVLIGAKVAEIVNEVVASNLGKNTMDKAKKISDDLKTKGDEEIEYVVDDLLQLCQSGHKLRRVGAQLQKAKSDGFMIRRGD
ncbi:beta-D-glucosyl crocetin beta-1,6-glucosyltransferase [Tanacetum coccineum]